MKRSIDVEPLSGIRAAAIAVARGRESGLRRVKWASMEPRSRDEQIVALTKWAEAIETLSARVNARIYQLQRESARDAGKEE